MATYKVIQDIESDDKLLGPLSLRQFIYAAIVVVQLFIAFRITTAIGNPLPFVFFLPTIAFFGLLAAPFGQDQSSEVWLLAKIRFFLKPRKRIWDQTGMKQLVTITAPKTIERVYTDGLSQDEVRSRLRALATTIDSRGWAVKNVNMNLSNPAFALAQGSDRLVAPHSLPQDVSSIDAYAADDMLDGEHNAKAQALDAKLAESSKNHLETAIARARDIASESATSSQQDDYWFMHQPDNSAIPAGQAAFAQPAPIIPGMPQQNTANDTNEAEQALLKRIHTEKAQAKARQEHHPGKVIQPLGSVADTTQNNTIESVTQQSPTTEESPRAVNPQIVQLANNNDLNISTIAHEANRVQDMNDDEVVISLH